ncbi:MAG: DUF2703 domain-containing protein [Syntrophobacterales bacterium]|nr:DUF2703 domain-containing protein [Syntrophobacterales bacterium]
MTSISLRWYHLVDENGNTCDRCDQTLLNLEKVISVIKPAFEEFDITIDFEKVALSYDEFKRNPLASNQITIDGRPLETILDLKVGKSPCCGPCAGNDCRTLVIKGVERDVIEARVILKAILESIAKKL